MTMGVEQSIAKVRAAVIKLMAGKSYVRPTGLVDSLAQETGEPRISVQQALARLSREKWIAGISSNGEAIAAVRIVGDVPPPPPNPHLDAWRTVLDEAGLVDKDIAALTPLYKQLSCFDPVCQREIVAGLLSLRENAEKEDGRHRFVVSARYLIGSSKVLDTMPASALKAFGIPVDRFPNHPLYVVAAGCAKPEAVILIENPAAFEMAVATNAVNHCAFIATFGFGLSKSQEDYGNQLANMVEERFSGSITLTREGSSCPTAKELLNHHNIMFWGDLDIAGIQIYQRLRKSMPRLRLSALYKPMLDAIGYQANSHPYVVAVGKYGQNEMPVSSIGDDAVADWMLAKCMTRGVDQECVLPQQVEQFASHVLAPMDESSVVEQSQYMTPNHQDERLESALEVLEKCNAARRTEPPPESEDHLWSVAIDMDTNKPVWTPKALEDEYQRLQFSQD
jgi:hypothetical protein